GFPSIRRSKDRYLRWLSQGLAWFIHREASDDDISCPEPIEFGTQSQQVATLRRSCRFAHSPDPRKNGSAQSAAVSAYCIGKVADSAVIGRTAPNGRRSGDLPHEARSLIQVPA